MSAFQWLAAALLVIGVGVCGYLAWRPSPFLTEVGFIPHEFARWADAQYNLRTSIPFFGLGIFGALLSGGRWRSAGYVFLGLFLFSGVLELGQLFISSRHPNWEDVFFGIAGAALGGLLCFPVCRWYYLKRRTQMEDS